MITRILFILGVMSFFIALGMVSSLKADEVKHTLVGTISTGSKHFLPFDLNEENGGLGIGYKYSHNKVLSSQVDHIRFTNSYFKDTEFTGYSLNYTPLYYDNFKLGIFGSIIYQEGYCGFFDGCKDGMDNTGFLPLMGGIVELDNVVIKGSALPSRDFSKIDAVVWTVQINMIEF